MSTVELEDTVGEAVIHNNMGLAYEMLNNLEQAQEHYEKVWYACCIKITRSHPCFSVTVLKLMYRATGKFSGIVSLTVWQSTFTTAKLESTKIS